MSDESSKPWDWTKVGSAEETEHKLEALLEEGQVEDYGPVDNPSPFLGIGLPLFPEIGENAAVSLSTSGGFGKVKPDSTVVGTEGQPRPGSASDSLGSSRGSAASSVVQGSPLGSNGGVLDEGQGASGGKMGFGNEDHVRRDALGPLEKKWEVWRDASLAEVLQLLKRNAGGQSLHLLDKRQRQIYADALLDSEVTDNLSLIWVTKHHCVKESLHFLFADMEVSLHKKMAKRLAAPEQELAATKALMETELTKARVRYESLCEHTRAEKKDLREQVNHLTARESDLSSEIKRSEQQRQRLEEQNEDMVKELSALQKRLGSQKDSFAATTALLSAVQAENRQLVDAASGGARRESHDLADAKERARKRRTRREAGRHEIGEGLREHLDKEILSTSGGSRAVPAARREYAGLLRESTFWSVACSEQTLEEE